MAVPYGYMIGLALLSLPALRPPRLPMPIGTVVFLLGITINELPVLAVVAFAASTTIAGVQGDLASPVATGTAILAAACLAVWIRRGARARSVLRRALAPTAVAGRLPLMRIVLLPFRVRPRWVERVANIAYGPFGRRNRMDLYRRRGSAGGAPVLIHFHGGHYRSGRKGTQAMPMLHTLAARGWVCISANYRLRPPATFEDHLVDVNRVVAWVREQSHEWGADPRRIFLSGSSAGAHMAMMAVLTAGDPAYRPGFEDVDTSVSGVVVLGGYYGRYFDGRPETSPTECVRADAPPTMVVHGDHDSVVPVDDARRFADRLRAVSTQRVVYAELPGGQHAFDLFYSPRFCAVVDAVEAFATEAFEAP